MQQILKEICFILVALLAVYYLFGQFFIYKACNNGFKRRFSTIVIVLVEIL